MRKLLFLLATTVASTSAFAGSTEQFCESEWPDDYAMQEYCIDQQNAAKNSVADFKSQHGLTADNLESKATSGVVPARILQGCKAEWPNDVAMVDYCVNQQAKSAKKLGRM